ncbi:peptide chain release factor 2 [Zhaonella formicivorans]|uniref:peptide chain release factor 2 n=1 Tax=Zhaonella formicivorans TaxID=2528593 RepID=UPI001D0F7AB1|nr:peptide chain release factor 2 [Zhaonella formicivorans]
MLTDYSPQLAEARQRLQELRVSLDIPAKESKIKELEDKMLAPDFWDDRDAAQAVMQTLTNLKDKVKSVEDLERELEDLEVLWELIKEEEDETLLPDLSKGLKALLKKLEELELETLLSGPYDKNNAILSLHAGAGGTEAQDWVEMLIRMYTRWCEEKNYQVEIMDYLAGDEAGVKSATILVKGENAYGYLKAEKGVHRLVRISPFDASGRRHTSFASVDVMPEVENDAEITIDPDDLKIDTYRSGGAGGQHVNKTDSAVRITHLPTGIVVQCQNERSQHANRLGAMKLLQAKLFELKRREQEEQLAEIRGEQMDIAWGSQIRSYTFHPYSLVKDHRTNVEIGNVQAVMDGNITPFIEAYLHLQASRS